MDEVAEFGRYAITKLQTLWWVGLMRVGYARTSTVEQQAGLDAQIRDLKNAGAERVFFEQVSSLSQRDQLAEVLRFVREGDELILTKPDRLARSTAELLKIAEELKVRKIKLIILSLGGQHFDASTPTGQLMLTMLGAIAQFERELMLERQREGIAKARLENKFKGRAPTARAKSGEVLELATQGLSRATIAKRLGIGEASVYRILASAKKAA